MPDAIVFSCPKWENIPSIDLYLDQVLILVNEAVAPVIPGQEKIITSTMVNNYVKQKLISPTEKKKYSRKQITEIIMVTLFKLVLSSAEIITVLSDLDAAFPTPEEKYSRFIETLAYELGFSSDGSTDSIPALSSAAVKAVAGKIHFYQVIANR